MGNRLVKKLDQIKQQEFAEPRLKPRFVQSKPYLDYLSVLTNDEFFTHCQKRPGHLIETNKVDTRKSAMPFLKPHL